MFQDIKLEHIRHIVDLGQAYETYLKARRDLHHRFRGSMRWKTVSGHQYLYRKIDGIEKSLGPRNSETETARREFAEGRDRLKRRIRELGERLRELAAVSRAYRLQRVPRTVAEILRKLDEAGVLGAQLRVVGTNALYAYEAAAGVRIDQTYMATADIDLLFDAREGLHLVGGQAPRLLALLNDVDRSFRLDRPRGYRAVNDEGFMVDIIAPLDPQDPLRPQRRRSRLTGADEGGGDDLAAQPIEGLAWLENAPPFEAMTIAEDGWPVRICTVDPRAFAAHKLWLAGRADREPLKARRDRAQAETILQLLREKLPHLELADPALSALPEELRRHLAS